MKIVQVIENFFPDSVGGTETYVLNISRIFMDTGHKVHIVAPSVNGTREYTYEGIQVHRFGIDKVASKDEYKQLIAPKGIEDFIEIIKRISPDVVHFNTFNRSVNIYHLKAVKQLGIKTFLTPHISGIFCAKGSLIDYHGQRCDGIVSKHDCVKCYMKSNGYGSRTILISKLAEKMLHLHHSFDKMIPSPAFLKQNRLDEYNDLNKCADGVIALSPWIKDTLIANGINNTYLVPQGISTIIKPDIPKASNDKLLKLIYVGRIFPIKSLETLCDALDMINENQFRLTIVAICGEDEYAKKLKEKLLSYKNVDWYENVSQRNLGKLLSNNDFLILTSISEMSPLVVLEAFACGIPVIASDIPPMSDHISNGKNGHLFPLRNAKILAKILDKYIQQPQIKLNLRYGVVHPPTFNEVSRKLLEIYSQ